MRIRFKTYCLFTQKGAIFEEVNERYKIYDLTKDCITADLGQEHGLIPSYKPPNGLGYFQFTQPEYIPVTSKVILMDEVLQQYFCIYIAKHRKHVSNHIIIEWKAVFWQWCPAFHTSM